MFIKRISVVFLIYFYLIHLLNASFSLNEQNKDMWSILSLITFVSEYDPGFAMEIKIPKLSKAVEDLHGKEIEIEGYIIPLTGQKQQSHFMLSKYPQSTCFFCGKTGPETAMQVFMKNDQKIEISERKIRVKGILYTNPKDIMSLLYTLENAVII